MSARCKICDELDDQCIGHMSVPELEAEIADLKKKLEIAVKAIAFYARSVDECRVDDFFDDGSVAREALRAIRGEKDGA